MKKRQFVIKKGIYDDLRIYEKHKNEPINKKYRGKTFEED